MAQNIADVNEGNFKAEVLEATTPVVVDFWATWCGPCIAMGPTVDQYAQEKAGAIKIVKVNVDQNGSLAAQYGVMSIPTFLVFSGGKPVGQVVGAMSKDAFTAKVDAALAGK
ncbi:MAG: thioredoxin [Armatimonadetes bacterium]|nr:thioredoxin [Armatimonadota bacterium]